jgi:hypothetical protein
MYSCADLRNTPEAVNIADSAALEGLSQLLSQYHSSSSIVIMDSDQKFALHEAAREGRSESLIFLCVMQYTNIPA